MAVTEIDYWNIKERIRNILLQSNVVSPEELDNIKRSIIKEIEEAVEFAKNSKFPEKETISHEVFAK